MPSGNAETLGQNPRMVEKKIFGEITSEWVRSTEKVVVAFPEICLTSCVDNDILTSIAGATKHKWNSAMETLNVMASNGWLLEHVYTTPGMAGVRTHYIISIATNKMKSTQPWSSSNAQSVRRR